MKNLVLVALLAGCTDDASEDLLDAWSSQVDHMNQRVGEYAQDVASASDVAAVTPLQHDYERDLDSSMGRMDHLITDLDDCPMMGRDEDHVHRAMADLDDMHGAIVDLLQDHQDHTDVAACRLAAEEHERRMNEHLDALREHREAFVEGSLDGCMHPGDTDHMGW